MPMKKRISLIIDKEHEKKLDFVKKCLKTKNNQKAIYLLLDLYCER